MKGKPVIKVSLLPLEWQERDFQHCFGKILSAAKEAVGLGVESENDIIVLFPSDRMVKGTGEEIDVEIHIPTDVYKPSVADFFAHVVFVRLEEILPKASIQVRCYRFDTFGFFSNS